MLFVTGAGLAVSGGCCARGDCVGVAGGVCGLVACANVGAADIINTTVANANRLLI